MRLSNMIGKICKTNVIDFLDLSKQAIIIFENSFFFFQTSINQILLSKKSPVLSTYSLLCVFFKWKKIIYYNLLASHQIL